LETKNNKTKFMFDRRLIQFFDWGLLLITLLIISIGLLGLYSAVFSRSNQDAILLKNSLFMKQIMWLGIGFVILFLSLFFNYRLLYKWAYLIYFLINALLILVLTNGKYVAGSRRWLDLGLFFIQPSELAKVSIIIMLAYYYSKYASEKGFSLKDLLLPFFYIMIPFVLILKQPDLGTAMLLLLNSAFITFFVKIKRRHLFVLISIIIISVPVIWFSLKGYQKERILAFIDPGRDPLGSGYHLIQSKIAIGSGMLTGKGFLKGTQNELSFLPEQHTDFIFSVLAEEWGFVGSFAIIILYFLLMLWTLHIANISRDNFGKILAVGICSMIYCQVTINIAMVMGLMPVVGVPLPFISYGGSSIIVTMIGISMLMNISMRRFMFD